MRILLVLLATFAFGADKTILLVAGKPSHPPGQHEHNAGVRLLAKWLNTVPGVRATASYNGTWPSEGDFANADAILFFSDGGDKHFGFAEDHPAAITKAAKRGAGLMFLHYAVEPPEKSGHSEMLDWLGGYFEPYYSINPHWDANYAKLPAHPVMKGVEPFTLRDEWYYNMRFREGKKGVTDLLVAMPPASTVGADGIRSGNADVRKKIGQPQTVAWAYLRPGGGRSLGLTGGHFHKNLGNENWRKVLLNGLLWVAKAPVPKGGVSVTVTEAELAEGLDPKPAPAPKGN